MKKLFFVKRSIDSVSTSPQHSDVPCFWQQKASPCARRLTNGLAHVLIGQLECRRRGSRGGRSTQQQATHSAPQQAAGRQAVKCPFSLKFCLIIRAIYRVYGTPLRAARLAQRRRPGRLRPAISPSAASPAGQRGGAGEAGEGPGGPSGREDRTMSSSCSSGDSDIADFVNAFGSDSEDGELPTPPTSAAAPVGAATATTVAEPEPEPEPGARAVDKLHSSSSAADPSVRGWEALCVSFRRSDPPAQVAEAFTSVAVRPKPGTFPFPRISSY